MNEQSFGRPRSLSDSDSTRASSGVDAERAAPGKRSASSAASVEAVQRKVGASDPGARISDWQMDGGLLSAMGLASPAPERAPSVQRKGAGADLEGPAALAAGARGISGASTALPHADAIQRSFGRHDVSGIQAHLGGEASAASMTLGAEAYATGNHVAFAAQPSLHTAAHEAAHVVQQRAGLSLKGGVGQAGDSHEQHADAVADRVVRGESAEGLLDSYTGGATHSSASSSGAGAVQRMRSDAALGATVSDNGGMAVVGNRTQELYASAALISATNAKLTSKNARVQLQQGAAWEKSEVLFKVIPQVVSGAELSKGVSDRAIHSVLHDLAPLRGDSDEVRAQKTEKYRAFWTAQRQMLVSLQTACAGVASLPELSPKSVRDFVEDERTKHAVGEGAEFFKTLALRNLVQELDTKLGELKRSSITADAVTAKVLEKRTGTGSEPDPFAELEEEEDPFAELEEDDTDLEANPPNALELELARESAYQDVLKGGQREAHGARAVELLQALFTKTLRQIDDEIAADGAEMIGPKWCSDMTRYLHASADLKTIPENEGPGRLHYKTKDENGNEMFHSAAVILQDGDDLVTLEADEGSGELPVGKRTWWFHMYGKEGATSFAHQTARRWGLE